MRWLSRGVVAFLILLLLVPIAFLLVRAGEMEAVRERVFDNPDTWKSMWRTVGLAGGVAFLCTALSLPLAWLTHATDLPGRRFFSAALILPLAVPSYVGGFVVISTFAPGGWATNLFGENAFPDVYGPFGVVVALMFTYPFALIALQAGLQRVDPRQWESARVLGDGPWRAFRRIVLPQLRKPMAAGSILVALYAIGDFGAVSLLRFPSLSYLVYLRHQSLFNRDEAVFLSLLLIAVALVFVAVLMLIGGRPTRQLSSQGTARRWTTIPLGKWKWPSFIFCSLVTAAGVGLPVGVVVSWLLRGYRNELEMPFPITELWRSAAVAGGAACLLVGLASIPSLARRYGGLKLGGMLKAVSNLGYALPGIVVALALVSVATRHAFAIYQTIWLLLIGYVIRFLPLAVHTVDDGLEGQTPRLMEAARSLGAGPARATLSIVLPAARPALFAGWIAVFIAVLKELPVTLILAPIEYDSLSTRIWSYTTDAYFAATAPVVLVLLALAVVGLLLRGVPKGAE